MRFGIMEMQVEQLIPPNLNARDAVDQILNFDRSLLIKLLVEQGFSQIELSGDLGLYFPSAYESKNIRRLSVLKQDLGLSYTVHLPLWSIEPATPVEPVRLGSVDAILDVMDALELLEPEVYVLHATGAMAAEFYRMGLPQYAKSLMLKQLQGNAINAIQMILEESGVESRKLAIETIEFPLELTLEIADLLDLSICLDTGHILAGFAGPTAFEDALHACLPRLAEVHLHDSPDFMRTGVLGYGKDHQPLGTQDLNVTQLIKHLQNRDFNGPVIFELSVKDAQQSQSYLKEIGVIS